MITDFNASHQSQDQNPPKLEDFAGDYLDYCDACTKAGVTPVPNPKGHIPTDATGKVTPVPNPKVRIPTDATGRASSTPIVKHLGGVEESRAQDSSAPARTVGFDPRTVEPFDGWTADQIRTVAVFHWDYLPLFSKEKTSWWAENSKGLEFFKRNFHKMAEAVPAKLTLERMEYAVKKATEPPKEYDYDPNCPNGCKGGFIREMQKVGRGHLPVIVCECECRRLVPVGTPMRKKQT